MNITNELNTSYVPYFQPNLATLITLLKKEQEIFQKALFNEEDTNYEKVLVDEILKEKNIKIVHEKDLHIFAKQIYNYINSKNENLLTTLSSNFFFDATNEIPRELSSRLEELSNWLVEYSYTQEPRHYKNTIKMYQTMATKWNIVLPQVPESHSNEEKYHYLKKCRRLLSHCLLDSAKQLQYLIKELKLDESDIILFTLGAAGKENQELPHYILNLAVAFPEKKVKLIEIDGSFCFNQLPQSYKKSEWIPEKISDNTLSSHRFLDKDHPNLSQVIFNFFLTADSESLVAPVLHKFIEKKLNESKLVFLGIHTQAFNLQGFESLEEIYNGIKTNSSNSQNLQLYIQGGKASPRLYGSALFDKLESKYAFFCQHRYFPEYFTEEDKSEIMHLYQSKHSISFKIGSTIRDIKFEIEQTELGLKCKGPV